MKVAYLLRRRTIQTRVKLAEICGVKKQAVTKWERRNGLVPDHHHDKVRQFLTQEKG